MNELIKVNFESERPTLLARELYDFLGYDKSQWARWYKKNIEDDNFFVENIDYITLDIKSNGNETKDFQLTIEMAKELSMLARNEKGKQARQYFIQLEKDWNAPEKVMARALKIADTTIKSLQLETKQQQQIIGELKPKADYTDKILKNKGLVTITQIAKDYGMTGNAMNDLLHSLGVQYKQSDQWLLYRQYHGLGYTHSQTINIVRSDGRPDIKMNTKWTQKGRLFIYNLLKDNDVLPVIEREDNHD